MRKGFNFYRSYYDVAKELSGKDRAHFLWALLQRQFEGIEPEDLKGSAKLAYISQKHSIDSQVLGYEAKTKTTLAPTEPPCQPPSEQEKEKEKEKVQYVSPTKFLEWFNQMKGKHCGSVGKFKSLTDTDVNNLKRLKDAQYTPEEFEGAFIAMSKSVWAVENKMITPAHFLRNDNFSKYVNSYQVEPKKFNPYG